MTAAALTDDDPPSARPDVWDAQRLASLLADVGEVGLRDILRLFMADFPFLQSRLAAAITTGNDREAQSALGLALDSAEALGLAALAATVRAMRNDPLAPGNPDILAQEVVRIRFVPSLKHAS